MLLSKQTTSLRKALRLYSPDCQAYYLSEHFKGAMPDFHHSSADKNSPEGLVAKEAEESGQVSQAWLNSILVLNTW